ncbi:hypothetical protein B0H16DRAFT_1454618 [Mycena metata]|uniref:Uncharacterized protein n=1 Tax=Mycena metata TaxID=1033252 RepID=A0AAD7JJT4_9AGAR|nr:hypothetical protein B0H16DRAFT_1454618 [Mycena metata]
MYLNPRRVHSPLSFKIDWRHIDYLVRTFASNRSSNIVYIVQVSAGIIVKIAIPGAGHRAQIPSSSQLFALLPLKGIVQVGCEGTVVKLRDFGSSTFGFYPSPFTASKPLSKLLQGSSSKFRDLDALSKSNPIQVLRLQCVDTMVNIYAKLRNLLRRAVGIELKPSSISTGTIDKIAEPPGWTVGVRIATQEFGHKFFSFKVTSTRFEASSRFDQVWRDLSSSPTYLGSMVEIDRRFHFEVQFSYSALVLQERELLHQHGLTDLHRHLKVYFNERASTSRLANDPDRQYLIIDKIQSAQSLGSFQLFKANILGPLSTKFRSIQFNSPLSKYLNINLKGNASTGAFNQGLVGAQAEVRRWM